MTLESLGPLVDELCAVLHGKGCTVREVSVTYSPVAKGKSPLLAPPPAGWMPQATCPPHRGSRRDDRTGCEFYQSPEPVEVYGENACMCGQNTHEARRAKHTAITRLPSYAPSRCTTQFSDGTALVCRI